MKANNDKCHLIVPNHNDVSVTLGKEHIIAEDSVTLLGVLIDSKLDFADHITSLLKVVTRVKKSQNKYIFTFKSFA